MTSTDQPCIWTDVIIYRPSLRLLNGQKEDNCPHEVWGLSRFANCFRKKMSLLFDNFFLFNHLFGPLFGTEREEVSRGERIQLHMNWGGCSSWPATIGPPRCYLFVIFLFQEHRLQILFTSIKMRQQQESKYLKTSASEIQTVCVATYSKREYLFFSDLKQLQYIFTWLGVHIERHHTLR